MEVHVLFKKPFFLCSNNFYQGKLNRNTGYPKQNELWGEQFPCAGRAVLLAAAAPAGGSASPRARALNCRFRGVSAAGKGFNPWTYIRNACLCLLSFLK